MNQLERVIELQRLTDELAAARERLGGVPDWMSELHEDHSARKAQIDELEVAAEETASARRHAESAIQDAQAKLEHYQTQVSHVRTQREYAALLQEIDTVKAQIKELEETALAALGQTEAARAEQDQAASDFEELDQRYQGELARWEEQKPEVEAKAKALETRLSEVEETLPKGVLALFRRLLEHRESQALAAIHLTETASKNRIYHCSACNYKVRYKVASEIRTQGLIVQCDSCRRILYFGPEDST